MLPRPGLGTAWTPVPTGRVGAGRCAPLFQLVSLKEKPEKRGTVPSLLSYSQSNKARTQSPSNTAREILAPLSSPGQKRRASNI